MVHGNEMVGKYVLDFFLKKTKKTPFCGKIILLEANVAAAKKNIRFIHADLNRSFAKDSDLNMLETKRANEIKEFFKKIKVDFVYDLHSTPSESDPMILCTSQTRSYDLAKKFPIKRIIKNLIDIVDGMSLVKYFTTR
jgi:succinylglutamate desuccinylase